jgi:hypothetical protein
MNLPLPKADAVTAAQVRELAGTLRRGGSVYRNQHVSYTLGRRQFGFPTNDGREENYNGDTQTNCHRCPDT